jgi:hypothetical protein
MRRLEMNVPMFLMVRLVVPFVICLVVRMNVREVFCDAHQIEMPVMYPALGTDHVGEGRHNRCCASQHQRLEAVLMVKLHVHRRDHDIVMIML